MIWNTKREGEIKTETTASCVLLTSLPCWFHNIKLSFHNQKQGEFQGVEFSVDLHVDIPVLIEGFKYCITKLDQ